MSCVCKLFTDTREWATAALTSAKHQGESEWIGTLFGPGYRCQQGIAPARHGLKQQAGYGMCRRLELTLGSLTASRKPQPAYQGQWSHMHPSMALTSAS